MPYDSLVSRTDAQSLIPEEVSRDWLGKAVAKSAALSLFRRIPVTRGQVRLPVLSALPIAYFVTGDTGLKQTSNATWTNKFVNMEELAVILPVAEAVLEDAETDLWSELEPLAVEAIGLAIDNAAFFGVNSPASWPTNIQAAATAAGNTEEMGTAGAAQGLVFGDMDQLVSELEADGFESTGWVASLALRSALRKARATDGQRLDMGRVSPDLQSFDGSDVVYAMRGLWPATTVAFTGQWDQFVIGVRQDITAKVLDQAVIQDNTGAIVYNLAQQDMVALRLVMRVGWQVGNQITRDQVVEANRYPAAVLRNEA